MARYGPTGNHFRQRFRAQIPDPEAAPNCSRHLSERRTLCGTDPSLRNAKVNSVIQ